MGGAEASGSLRDEMRAAVLGPGVLVVTGVERTFLPVRDRREADRGDSVAHEKFLRGRRAALPERQVLPDRPSPAAVPPHDGLGAAVALKESGVVSERRLRAGAE